jgi:hypothetical protein
VTQGVKGQVRELVRTREKITVIDQGKIWTVDCPGRVSTFRGSREWRWKVLQLPDTRSHEILIRERRISTIDREEEYRSLIYATEKISGYRGSKDLRREVSRLRENEVPMSDREI